MHLSHTHIRSTLNVMKIFVSRMHVQERKYSGLGNSKLCLGTGCRYSQARIYHYV